MCMRAARRAMRRAFVRCRRGFRSAAVPYTGPIKGFYAARAPRAPAGARARRGARAGAAPRRRGYSAARARRRARASYLACVVTQ